jgi:hypothetical protein
MTPAISRATVSGMRIRSEIWVKAYLRRCEVAGVPAVVVRRGDDQAGAIYLSINRLDGTVSLYGPAPAGLETGGTERRFVICLSGDRVAGQEADRYLSREAEFDSDFWVVEIEDRQGRHLLVDVELG